MSNVGYATLTILPSARGFSSALGREINPALTAAGAASGEHSGRAFGGGFLPTVKTMVGAAAGLGIGMAVGQGIKSGLETAAFLEQAKISFQTLLGPGGDAEGFLKSLSDFAAKTPFELPGLTSNARALLGVGIAAKDVIPTMTALGDAAGALGLSQDGLNSVVRAYTQINSKGKVSAEEMLQMAEAGIPAWPLLARAMGMTVPEVQKLGEEGKLLASDVLPKLNAQMEKEYGGSMAKQAQTLSGVWSTVKDTINMAMAQALQPLVPILTTVLPPAAAALATAIGWLSDQGVRLGTAVAPAVQTVGAAAGWLWDILAKGDFKGNIFGIQEDSHLVDFLFNLRGAAQYVADGFRGIGSSFMAYFGPIGDQIGLRLMSPLQHLGDSVVALVAPAFAIFKDIIDGLFAAFAPLASILATYILPALVNLGTAISTGVQPVLAVIGDILRTSVIPAFQEMATKAAPVFMQLGQTIDVVAQQVGPILQGLADVIRNVWGFIGPFVMDTLMGIFNNVLGIFSGVFTVIQGVVNLVSALFRGDWNAAWQALGQIVSGAVQAVWNFVQIWIIGRVAGAISGAMGFIRGLFGGAWDAIVGIVSGAGGRIGGFISGLMSNVVSWFSGGMARAAGAVGDGIGTVIGWFGGLLGRIAGAMGNAGSALWGIGQNIIQGLINGIGSMMGAIGRAILNLVPGPIVGVFKDLLGIHSPSRVFRGFGVNIGEGLILGIQDMHGDVEDAVAKLAGIPAGTAMTSPNVALGGIQGALAANAGAGAQPTIVQENHFNTPMSEEAYAELAARKLLRAGVGR